jgi:protein-L-isoaspartate(D-aspartate) O-methyltransferase
MLKNDLARRDITDPAVLETFDSVPRERFVPKKYASQAYTDNPLPIGMGQTISQPYIVALMTQHLKLNDQCTVLEIGTGSGYQTAILAKLARKVCTIEKYDQLSESAQTILAGLNIKNVEFCISDGSKGWPDNATFDRIIITAAAPSIPAPLIDQLNENGIMVIPLGDTNSQILIAFEKIHGDLIETEICPVRFVKLTGEHGFGESD